MAKNCPNCGLQIDPPAGWLGETPVEALISETDEIRQWQLAAIRAGHDPRHSIALATEPGVRQ